ncbi:MAG: hypothetical protein IIA59_06240 [Candidatus Marinimicrobia bacterium]|nr:hypothetical protein [Candidatus Neomarinimicrobiota bacterium]
METPHFRSLIPGLALSLMVFACGGQPVADQTSPTITLVATGNVNNEVGPCG